MSRKLFLATDDGLTVGEQAAGAAHAIVHSLKGRQLTCVIAREGVILAGATDGIYRSDDGGLSWEEANTGLSIRHVRWLAYHPQVSDLELAGTEPAGIFVSHNGGDAWQERPEVGRLRDSYNWFLPYSAAAGCVRGFAAHGDRLYAAVEVGGLLHSDDRGENWKLVQGSDGLPKWGRQAPGRIHPDVHSVTVHSSSPDLVYAPTGGGFYFSENGGRDWRRLYKQCYCRAVWVDPDDPAHIVLGPADSVDRNGRIELSEDGGRNWRLLGGGSDMPWTGNMVERFEKIEDRLYAVLANGQLLTAMIGAWDWQRVFENVVRIRAVAAEPDA
jgi:photosystem II stability/assembly factor-like uncharacterized protein